MVVPIAASGAGETNAQRLDDIGAAIAVIDNHVGRGALSDGLIFEAVRARLIETGEALEAISPALL